MRRLPLLPPLVMLMWLTPASLHVSAGPAASGQPVPALSSALLRPVLPDTFLNIELEQFPTLQGTCNTTKPSTSRAVMKVGPSQPFKSISAALKNASSGAIIIVDKGLFVENPKDWFALNISLDDICLRGAGVNQTRIVASPGQKYGVILTGSRISLMGLTVQGCTACITMGRSDGQTQRGIVLNSVTVIGKSGKGTWVDGIVSYPDHRGTGVPTVDGLLLHNVRLYSVTQGVSCGSGPCHHWWLNRVSIYSKGGGDNSGADTFAVESGRQVIVTSSFFTGAGADGIDIKGSDALVVKATVQDVARNGIKLWKGGDVQDCIVNGTGADASLVGESSGRYRYLRSTITQHNVGLRSYLGTWGYDTQRNIDLEVSDCIFRNNSQGAGLWVPSTTLGTKVKLTNNAWFDVGENLLIVGSEYVFDVSGKGIQDMEKAGFGSRNTVGSQ